MDKDLSLARGMFANHGMGEIVTKTRELIDCYGYTGAEIYLQAQIQMLHVMSEEEKEGEDFGDDF